MTAIPDPAIAAPGPVALHPRPAGMRRGRHNLDENRRRGPLEESDLRIGARGDPGDQRGGEQPEGGATCIDDHDDLPGLA